MSFNPYIVWCIDYVQLYMPVKVCIYLISMLEDVFHWCMNVCSYSAAIVFDQTHVISIGNAG